MIRLFRKTAKLFNRRVSLSPLRCQRHGPWCIDVKSLHKDLHRTNGIVLEDWNQLAVGSIHRMTFLLTDEAMRALVVNYLSNKSTNDVDEIVADSIDWSGIKEELDEVELEED